MSNENDTTTPEDAGCGIDSHAESSRTHISRASKACENCRIRRIKCEPPYPCKACRLAKLTGCHVRPKARPGRQSRQQDPSKILKGTGYRERTSGLERLDKELEAIFEERTGGPIDLKVVEEHTHPLLDLSSPLPTLPSLDSSASAAIRQFTIYCLPYCSFLTPTRISHLFDRYEAAPLSLSPDQRALVYVCLACGYIRLQYFGEGGRLAKFVPEEERLDVVWYRQAVDALDKWGSATFTSLHALFCMWFYTTLVCKSDATRFVCSWMISQARELGLHQEQTALAVPYSPSDRADLMFVMILYAHYYSVALCGHPPMIKPGEFDTVIFHSSDLQVDDPSSAIVPRRAVVELLLLNTQAHLNLHDEVASNLSIDWLLRIEHNWTAWRRSWIKHGRPVWDPYTGILWDWSVSRLSFSFFLTAVISTHGIT
ncbi:hypothetical protein BCR39DRAFT_391227 [Naematelia encephala]|uniref:Zn(2)-C6 fungal-type domain-containing protein n=1 Tax=Naematelia encephala TaxID=71784 RepID=A0A1Y2AHW7_9TREE|nr:hypothetical protein BCR39DRAFT_391227 [Naematelia encephala]